MTPQYLLIAIPVLLFLTIFEMVMDGIRKKKHFGFQDTLTNLSCGIGNQGLNLFTEGLKLFLFIDIFFYKLAFFVIPNTWWSVLLCLAIIDLAFYWSHRFSHIINILWGTHVVHHSSEEFNLSIALRRSWIADIVTIVFFLPIPMMGFGPETFLTAAVLHNFYQFIIHTRGVGKLHWLVEYVMHTPSHHRVHHGKDPKYIDKNFSGVFILWDRLFRTFQEEEEEPTYGITTQLHTNNPALVNIHYYVELFQNVGRMDNWKDKLHMLFGRPGWFPEKMGGFRAPPEVDKEMYRKYDSNTPRTLNYYILSQFLMAFLGLIVLLIGKKYLGQTLFPPAFEIGFFLVIAISSIIPIALFDRGDWLRMAEHLRLIVAFGIVVLFVHFQLPQYLIPALILTGIGYLVMNRWFEKVWGNRFSHASHSER